MEMTKIDVEQIGNEMFPDSNGRWGKKLATLADVSAPLISQIRNGAPISTKTANKLHLAHEAYINNDGVHVTPVAPARNLVASIVLRDPVTNRFVANDDIPAEAMEKLLGYVNEIQATETDEAIIARINKRFEITDRMVQGVISGAVVSTIIYGPAGLGKSYNVLKALRDEIAKNQGFRFDLIKGSCTAPNLYEALYASREKGDVIVLDDCDSIYDDEEALNLLKGALDSTDERTISWRKNSTWITKIAYQNLLDNGFTPEVNNFSSLLRQEELAVKTFEFKGAVIFITNKNLKKLMLKGGRMAPHFDALISRSMYIDLSIDTDHEKMLRVEDVFLKFMAPIDNLTEAQANEIVAFVKDNMKRMHEISLRSMKLITQIYKADPDGDWKAIVELTRMD